MDGNSLVKSNMEIMMENFMICQATQNNEHLNQNMHISEVRNKLAAKVDFIATYNKMLETRISQMA